MSLYEEVEERIQGEVREREGEQEEERGARSVWEGKDWSTAHSVGSD